MTRALRHIAALIVVFLFIALMYWIGRAGH